MQIVDVVELSIPDVRVVRFARFHDGRGYFTETFRRSDLETSPGTRFLSDLSFPQANESYSQPGVVRGLHFQWSPYMGKLVRTVAGRMVDLALDIRLGSPTFGKIVAYDMPSRVTEQWSEWIWVPPGFAHGNFFTEESVIEYMCTGEYSQGNEAAVSPLAQDIDWSACDSELRREFRSLVQAEPTISDKDLSGHTVASWRDDPRSSNFHYSELTTADT